MGRDAEMQNSPLVVSQHEEDFPCFRIRASARAALSAGRRSDTAD